VADERSEALRPNQFWLGRAPTKQKREWTSVRLACHVIGITIIRRLPFSQAGFPARRKRHGKQWKRNAILNFIVNFRRSISRLPLVGRHSQTLSTGTKLYPLLSQQVGCCGE